MQVSIRVSSAPRFWRRRWKKCDADPATDAGAQMAQVEGSESPLMSVSCSPGTLATGPLVAMGIKLAGKRGLLVEMRVHEACDLAEELLAAARHSERKYSLKYGTE